MNSSTGFEFDAKKHKYFLDGREMTGCTTILGVIAKPALIQWAANMAVDYLKGLEHDLLTADDFEAARKAHTRKRDDAAQKGTDTHALVEEYIKFCIAENGGEPQLTGTEPHSIRPFQEWAQRENIRFLASEQQVYSRSLFVAGTYDFMFEKDGKRYVGDLKTMKKLYDRLPIMQCAGYALMWEEMRGVEREFEHNEQHEIDGYCIFNLPKERAFDEKVDVPWSWDTEGDREAFTSAVRLYRYLQQK
jgi:hypothetical protein